MPTRTGASPRTARTAAGVMAGVAAGFVAGVMAACSDGAFPTPVRNAFTPANSSACVPMPAGAIHWYRGEGDARDAVGSADGTNIGTVTFVGGMVGTSAHYDGATGYMALGNVLPRAAGTVEFWVRRDAYRPGADYDVFFGGVDRPFGDGRATVLALYSGGPSAPDELQWEFGQATALHAAASLPLGTWHHLAITWVVRADNSASAAVYVDGSAVGTASTTLTAGDHGFAPPWVGAYDDIATGVTARNFANAAIDEVTIYDRELSAGEIAAIHDAGAAGKCDAAPPPPPPPTFAFAGFFAPVAMPPAVNAVNAGRTIPMKFSLGGDQGLGILAAGAPQSGQVDCAANDPPATTIETATAGGSGLRYDATSGTYTYAWKTEKEWTGTCRDFILTLTDGTTHRARFTFTR